MSTSPFMPADTDGQLPPDVRWMNLTTIALLAVVMAGATGVTVSATAALVMLLTELVTTTS